MPLVSIGGVELDATFNEVLEGRSEITKHPVESGASPADHTHRLPDMLTIEAAFTETPAEGARHGGQRGDLSYSLGKLGALEHLRDTSSVVQVVLPWRVMNGMIIESIRTPFDRNTGDSVRALITLQQVVFVETQSVRLGDYLKPTKIPTKPNVDKKAKPNDASAPVEASKVAPSILKDFGNAFGVLTPGKGIKPQ